MRLCLLSNRIVRVGCPIPLIAALFTPMGSAQIVEHRLTASDGADVDFFGQSVAIDGDRAVIGAPLDDDLGDNSGAAYIFERQGDGSWLEIDKLTSSDGGTEQRFAQSVALSGDYVVVGVPSDGEVGINGGAAYAFERQGDGSWLEVSKVTASDGVAQALFGFEVALKQNRLAITAPGDDDNGMGSGAAYLFERQGDGFWLEVHKLITSDGTNFDSFGDSVSLSADRVLIGAKSEDGAGPADSGSAYVFERQGDGSWMETAKLTASDAAMGDFFGISVALSGDYAIAGGVNADPLGDRSGAAWAFERQGDGSWLETDRILPSDGVTLDFFGFSAAVEGEDAVIGAYGTDTTSPFGGALYAFTRQSDGTWTETAKLEASDGQSAALGIALAFSQGRVLGGADASDNGRGAAYLYENVFPVPIELTPDAPAGYRLTGVYPNPVVGRARFELSVARPQNVRIEVYDMLGRRRAILYDALIAAHSTRAFPFDTDSWASGTYLLRVSGETFSTAKTLTVLK